MVGDDKPLSNGVILYIHAESEDYLGNAGLSVEFPGFPPF